MADQHLSKKAKSGLSQGVKHQAEYAALPVPPVDFELCLPNQFFCHVLYVMLSKL